MKQTATFFFLSFLITFASCSNQQEAQYIGIDPSSEKSPERKTTAPDLVIRERKIIKQGEVTFETSDATETKKVISKHIAEYKGYISEDRIADFTNKTEHRVTLRVPSDKFDLLLAAISGTARKLDSKNISASDVTEEFVDIEARIRTKKELENRYKELLKKAVKVDEILNIEKEIGNLRTEIESIEGRLNYLKDQVSLSTLTVVFYEQSHSSFGFAGRFGEAIKNGWTNLLWFFISLVNLWPFVLAGFAGIIIYRQAMKRRKNKATSTSGSIIK